MKNSLKVILSGLTITCLIYSGCKKADLAPTDTQKKQQISQAEVAKKVALEFYKSISANFGSSKSTTSASGLTTMDEKQAQCGDFTETPTDEFFTRSDTTFTLKGNSLFTFTCSEGNEKNPYGPDGYTLVDYLNKKEEGKNFINTFENSLNYVVTNPHGILAYSIHGDAYASARFATTGEKDITEYHDFSTKYKVDGLGGTAVKDSPATFQGQVGFECKQADVYLSAAEKNTSIEYRGFMIVNKDIISSYFFVEGEKYYLMYELDVNTKKIISGPTKVAYENVK